MGGGGGVYQLQESYSLVVPGGQANWQNPGFLLHGSFQRSEIFVTRQVPPVNPQGNCALGSQSIPELEHLYT